jgi:hypothetical protein
VASADAVGCGTPRVGMRAIAVILLVLAIALPAAAASGPDLPRFPAKAYCQRIAGVGGSYSETIFGACLTQEQAAYDDLKPRWGTLLATIRAHCIRIATVGGAGSYGILSSCIEQESKARDSNATTEFKY